MLALGLGFLAQFFTVQGIPILAVPYYQMTLGVDPFLLSIAMMGPLLFGSAIGPWVGHLSDACNSRFGRRRPFIFVGAWGLCISYGLLWMVPQSWSSSAQIVYFFIVACAYYVAGAIYTVPLTSMVYELSDDPHQRTRILGFTTYFFKTGSLMYQWVFPIAQLAIFGSVIVGIKFVGWGIGIFIFALMGMLPALFIREATQPNGIGCVVDRVTVSFKQSLGAIINNREMRLLIIVVFIQMGACAGAAMMDYYLLVYFVHAGDIGTGAVWKGVLSTSYALAGMACVPLVVHFSKRVGKLTALKCIFIINIVGGVAKWFIFVPGARWGIVLDAVLCSAVWTAMVVLIPSMISDLNAQQSMQSSTATKGATGSQAGAFAAVHGWAASFAGVTAFIASGFMLNLIGFNAASGAAQPEQALLCMRIILSGGTAVFSLCALAVLHYLGWSRQNSQLKQTFTS
ncbi:major facilitator superfamily MFS_1 [Saccharophagus degradans 2-40]|uniref:Major facilitator superfamily MFS_1 n=2 Tax=Saccharophagus degradans TaxID=86304 RepID=Q21MY2_SACD2|nr:major facilitator superfamily MFS_1 [Saccharophagus degradans 2-40]